MKIGILSSASGGGAGIAAKRISSALNSLPGYSADFIDIASVYESVPFNVVVSGNLSNYRFTDTHFTGEYMGFVRGWLVDMLSNYDLLNVHWASYLVTTSELLELASKGVKILITMHDFYYSTGGCHYQAGCNLQYHGCMDCPQVNLDKFSHYDVMNAYKYKKQLLAYPNVHISAPSNYLVTKLIDLGIVSNIKGHTIRNIYIPVADLKSVTNLNTNNIVLIADSLEEKRKGMMLAINSLAEVSNRKIDIIVHMVGYASDDLKEICRKKGIKAIFYGRITNHSSLVEIYSKCQLLLTCSFEDNWPNILVEAGCYGVVPVVGSGHGCEEFCIKFNIGSIVNDYTPNCFADALIKQIQNYPKRELLYQFSKNVKNEHSTKSVVASYTEVFNSIPDATGIQANQKPLIISNSLSKKNISVVSSSRTPFAKGPYSNKSFLENRYGIKN